MKRILSLALILCLAFLTVSDAYITRAATYNSEYQVNLTVRVNGSVPVNVRAVNLSYDNNTYVSLRDMAYALRETDKAFDVEVTETTVALTLGKPYTFVGTEELLFETETRDWESPEYINTKNNTFTINGGKRIYFTAIYPLTDTIYDCYMFLPDFLLMMDMSAEVDDGVLFVRTDKPVTVNIKELEQNNFFFNMNAVLVGDATSGEIYYSYNGDTSYAMASTTKLMTYLVAMDLITEKKLPLTTKVTVSEAVNRLSYSSDYTIHLETGQKVTLSDLLFGMLLPSSNECALCLAENLAGSEEKFVKLMNEKAAEIGMGTPYETTEDVSGGFGLTSKASSTCFYNVHGLPEYTEAPFIGKYQNYTTAQDMFRLVCNLLTVYPQVTEITSTTRKKLTTMSRTVNNTNALLFNVKDAVGLKTGSTNRAGNCLVSAVKVMGEDGYHTIVAIEFGGENQIVRNNVSTTLLTYGKQVFLAGGTSSIEGFNEIQLSGLTTPSYDETPDNPEDLARRIVWVASKYRDITNVCEEDPEETEE